MMLEAEDMLTTSAFPYFEKGKKVEYLKVNEAAGFTQGS